MNRTLFARILDTCFIVLGIGFVFYAWLFRFLRNIPLCLVATGIASFLLAKLFWRVDKKFYNKYNLKKSELQHTLLCTDYFSKNRVDSLKFFAKLFDAKVSGNFVLSKDTIYYVDYYHEKTTLDTICKITNMQKKYPNKKFVLLSNELSEKANTHAKNNNIFVASGQEIYLKMKEENIFPKDLPPKEKHKFSFQKAITNAIDKKKAKQYILYGALLISFSFFIPFTSWYIFVGTIFICLSITSLFAKRSDKLS